MRPKIVVLILIVAIGVVALAAVLKGVLGGHAPQEATAPEPPPAQPASPTATSPQVGANSTNTAAILEQLRAAEVEKELDQIRELQAAGADNPQTTGLLLGKVTHREPEVRKAALEALVQLNDTNAIPGLEQAASLIEDPREKVAVMDAVSYLKLPSMADGTSPELAVASNYQASATSPRQVVPNPRFQPGANKQGRRQNRLGPGAAQPVPQANPGQTQPPPTAPDPAQPAPPPPDTAPPSSPAPETAPPQ
jgi:hypothetical protein